MKRLQPDLVLFGQLYHSGSFFCSELVPGIIKSITCLPKSQNNGKIRKKRLKMDIGQSRYINIFF